MSLAGDDAAALAITAAPGGARFAVRAKPRARASRVEGVKEGALAVALAAPPVDGAANEELVATLARALGVPRRDVVLVRGEASRAKLVEIRGLDPEAVRARLQAAR